jgi:hypothetical protein
MNTSIKDLIAKAEMIDLLSDHPENYIKTELKNLNDMALQIVPAISELGWEKLASPVTKSLDFSTKEDEAVFWTGYEQGNQQIAMAYARCTEKCTLEMTQGGKLLHRLRLYDADSPIKETDINGEMKRPFVDALFNCASKQFAIKAKGIVKAFVVSSIRSESTFARVEKPNVNAVLEEVVVPPYCQPLAQEHEQLVKLQADWISKKEMILRLIGGGKTGFGEKWEAFEKELYNILGEEATKKGCNQGKVMDLLQLLVCMEKFLQNVHYINELIKFINSDNASYSQCYYPDLFEELQKALFHIHSIEHLLHVNLLTEKVSANGINQNLHQYLDTLNNRINEFHPRNGDPSGKSNSEESENSDDGFRLFNELLVEVTRAEEFCGRWKITKIFKDTKTESNEISKKLDSTKSLFINHFKTKLNSNKYCSDDFIDHLSSGFWTLKERMVLVEYNNASIQKFADRTSFLECFLAAINCKSYAGIFYLLKVPDLSKRDALISEKEDALISEKEDALISEKEEALISEKEEYALISEKEEALISEKEEEALISEKKEEALISVKEEYALISEKEEALVSEKEEYALVSVKEEYALISEKEEALVSEKEEYALVSEKEEDCYKEATNMFNKAKEVKDFPDISRLYILAGTAKVEGAVELVKGSSIIAGLLASKVYGDIYNALAGPVNSVYYYFRAAADLANENCVVKIAKTVTEILSEGGALEAFKKAAEMKLQQVDWLRKQVKLLHSGVLETNPVIKRHWKIIFYYGEAARHFSASQFKVAEAEQKAAETLFQSTESVWNFESSNEDVSEIQQGIMKTIKCIRGCNENIAKFNAKALEDKEYEKVVTCYEKEELARKDGLKALVEREIRLASEFDDLADLWGREVAVYRQQAIANKKPFLKNVLFWSTQDNDLYKLNENVAIAKEEEAEVLSKLIKANQAKNIDDAEEYSRVLKIIGSDTGAAHFFKLALTFAGQKDICQCYSKVAQLKKLEVGCILQLAKNEKKQQELRKESDTNTSDTEEMKKNKSEKRKVLLETLIAAENKIENLILLYRRKVSIMEDAVVYYEGVVQFKHISRAVPCYKMAADILMRHAAEAADETTSNLTELSELAELDSRILQACGTNFGAIYYFKKAAICSTCGDSDIYNRIGDYKEKEAIALQRLRNVIKGTVDKRQREAKGVKVGVAAAVLGATVLPLAVGLLVNAFWGNNVKDENASLLRLAAVYNKTATMLEALRLECNADVVTLTRQTLIKVLEQQEKVISSGSSGSKTQFQLLSKREEALNSAIVYFNLHISFSVDAYKLAAETRIEEDNLLSLLLEAINKRQVSTIEVLEKALAASGKGTHSAVYFFYEAAVVEQQLVAEQQLEKEQRQRKQGIMDYYSSAAKMKRKESQFLKTIALMISNLEKVETAERYRKAERGLLDAIRQSVDFYLKAVETLEAGRESEAYEIFRNAERKKLEVSYLVSKLPKGQEQLAIASW